MKQSKTVLILILLLVFLLGGGTLLYQKLSAPAQTSAPEPVADASIPENAPEPAADLTADFTVQDEQGNAVSLSDFIGRPVIVNFWATWCPPCRSELPYFDAAAKDYAGQIEFLMVDLTDGYSDTVESATAFARDENGYSFPLYFDVEYSAVEAYRINAIPVTLFVRADGSLLHQQLGAMSEAELQSYLTKLLDNQ